MKSILLAFALVCLTACSGMANKPSQPAAKDALYQELGRSEGITRVVDLFFQRLNAAMAALSVDVRIFQAMITLGVAAIGFTVLL